MTKEKIWSSFFVCLNPFVTPVFFDFREKKHFSATFLKNNATFWFRFASI